MVYLETVAVSHQPRLVIYGVSSCNTRIRPTNMHFDTFLSPPGGVGGTRLIYATTYVQSMTPSQTQEFAVALFHGVGPNQRIETNYGWSVRCRSTLGREADMTLTFQAISLWVGAC